MSAVMSLVVGKGVGKVVVEVVGKVAGWVGGRRRGCDWVEGCVKGESGWGRESK